MWVICQFDEDDMIEAIPKFWLLQRNSLCLWPPYKGAIKINKAIEEKVEPEGNWNRFKLKRVFTDTETYEEALEKVDSARNTSDVDEDYRQKMEKKCRSIRHKKHVISSDEETDNSNIVLSESKFPPPPSPLK